MPRDKRNQVNATVGDEIYNRILAAVERYGKKDKSRVAAEIIETYIGLYEAAEEAALAVRIEQQSVLGKAPAPATTSRRARKVA